MDGARRGAYEGNTTDGAYMLAPEARGPVDTPADSDYQTGFFTGGRQADTWNVFGQGALYSEDRGNGTPAQVNTTDWKQFSSTPAETVGGGVWQVQGAASSQDYYQTFTAVAADRASERLTTEQTIDTNFQTVGGQWTRLFGRTTLIVGADFQRTDSTVEELRYSVTNVQTGPFFAGGIERTCGGYARASIPLHRRVHRRARRARGRVDVRADRLDAARQVGYVLQPAGVGRVARRPLRDSGRGLSRQPSAEPQRTAPRLPCRQRRHQPEPAAGSRNADRCRRRRARVVGQCLRPRHRVLQRSRRRNLEHHAVEHADADHPRSGTTPTRFAPPASSSRSTRG